MKKVLARVQRMMGRREFDPGRRFSEIYEKNLFNGGESRSGKGSRREQTAELQRELPALLRELNVREFLDAPCGDCNWIGELDWKAVRYTGADVVPALIEANRAR